MGLKDMGLKLVFLGLSFFLFGFKGTATRPVLPEPDGSPFVRIHSNNIVCGATLLSSNIAITAKHCIIREEKENPITEGLENFNVTVNGIDYAVEEAVSFNDGYQPHNHINHDLIILKLQDHVSGAINFAKIPHIELEEHLINSQNNQNDGTGMILHGRSSGNSSDPFYMEGHDVSVANEVLLNHPEANFKLYDNDSCRLMGEKVNRRLLTDDNAMCIRAFATINATIDGYTYTQDIRTPITSGDSGSGISYKNINGTNYILGVVSAAYQFPRLSSYSAKAWLIETAKYLHEKYNDEGVRYFFNSLPNKDFSLTVNMNGDMDTGAIQSHLQQVTVLTIKTADGEWGGNIYLPNDGIEEGRLVKFIRSATWDTKINVGDNLSIRPAKGEVVTFTYKDGRWSVRGFSGPPLRVEMSGDMDTDTILSYLGMTDELTIISADGAWGRYINLPNDLGSRYVGKKLTFTRQAGMFTEIKFTSFASDIAIGVTNGESLTLNYNHNGWWRLQDTEQKRVSLSRNLNYDSLLLLSQSTKNLIIETHNGEWSDRLRLPLYAMGDDRTITFIRHATFPTEVKYHIHGQYSIIPDIGTSTSFVGNRVPNSWDIR